MSFAAVILAGGASSRMGQDKAFLRCGAETLLARQVRLARAAGAKEIFISGRATASYPAEYGRVLRDQVVGAGPLAGISAALEILTAPRLLVLAVDLPSLNENFLRQLLSVGTAGVIPRCAGNPEPLAAVYPAIARSECAERLRTGRNSVRDFAAAGVAAGWATWLELPTTSAELFFNCNSPADLPLNPP